ncbi:hypothetical protein [Ideonella oryzae]|uniref:Poly(3-hydroxyalkanoate) polymerase subunit PhaE n=1 Tax=Ideonella oryzae TaxID=2937441 RepID=A0ABT1BNJ5_9BURK|nr:hypothetical protein [Ideonella oryzae]MCO5977698.1 hypothetical protein [Ideonella oryzae]
MATATTQQDSSQSGHKTFADLGDAWLAWQIALLQGNRLPLSGDVTQWIKTWGEIVGQVGLVNFNIAGSSDPQTEQRIGRDYSYGRQLGRIVEVLKPYLDKHKDEFKGSKEQDALNDFLAMADKISEIKAKQHSVDDVLARVKKWQDDDDFEAKREALIKGLEALARR